jgi:flagellar hook assembly protein FlgD
LRAEAYPNPAGGPVDLRFALTEPGSVAVSIFDVQGRLVRIPLDRALDRGPHALRWSGDDLNGSTVPAGVYYFELRAEGQRVRLPVVLIR